jgi:hypothetical protein
VTDDGSLDDLFSSRDEPVEEAEPTVKRRSTGWWFVRNVLLITALTVVTVAALRAGGHHISVLLVVAFWTGLRVVLIAVSEVAPPSLPKRRGGSATADGTPPDSLRAAVRRWERNLDRAHADADLYARNVLPVLAELADERLRLRHGITRASDPRRARDLLGDPLWAALHDPGRRTAKSSELETYVTALERL